MKTTKRDATLRPIDLFLECASDFAIVDQNGRQYTAAEAEVAWNGGLVETYNMGLWRLAQNRFDLDATKAYFEEMKKLDPKLRADHQRKADAAAKERNQSETV